MQRCNRRPEPNNSLHATELLLRRREEIDAELLLTRSFIWGDHIEVEAYADIKDEEDFIDVSRHSLFEPDASAVNKRPKIR